MRGGSVEGLMDGILTFTITVLSIFSLLIVIRIIISWFGGFVSGKPVEILAPITDPYLNWWGRHFPLRIGFVDFSVIVAIVFLSFVQNILFSILYAGKISLGVILAIVISSVWGILSFVIGFCVVVLILRLIAYLINSNMYGMFWRLVDSISQPLLYRLNRMIFGNRITTYFKSIVIPTTVLIALWILGKLFVPALAVMVAKLPV
jgi:YggT family protein